MIGYLWWRFSMSVTEADGSDEGDKIGQERVVITSKTGDDPLPTSCDELLEVVCDRAAVEARRRKSFAALKKVITKNANELGKLIEGHPADASLTARWVIGELAYVVDEDKIEPTTLEYVRQFVGRGLLGVLDRVTRTEWITTQKNRPRRGGVESDTDFDYHSLLLSADDGSWPPPGAQLRLEDAALPFADEETLLAEWSAIDLPAARELMARRSVLAVRDSDDSFDKLERRVVRSATKALEPAVIAIRQVFERSDSNDAVEVERLLLLPRLVGRSADFWNELDKQRASLTKVAPDNLERSRVWAQAMSTMPCKSKLVSAALADVPDASLIALLEVSVTLEHNAMVGLIQDVALSRARTGSGTPIFWQRLGEFAPASPKLAKWWQTIMASFAPSEYVQLDDQTQGHLLLSELRRAEVPRVLGEDWVARIDQLSPVDRLRALALLTDRLLRALPTLREQQISSAITKLRARQTSNVELRRRLNELLGSIPPSVDVAIAEAERSLHGTIAELEQLTERVELRTPIARAAGRDQSLGDVTQALHAADRLSSEADQAATLGRLHDHLLWLAANAPLELSPVAASLSTLPPEALGIVLNVALSQRHHQLLHAVDSTLATSQPVRVIWGATLRSQALSLYERADLPTSLTAKSADILKPVVKDLNEEAHEVERGATIERTIAQSIALSERPRAALNELLEKLAHTLRSA